MLIKHWECADRGPLHLNMFQLGHFCSRSSWFCFKPGGVLYPGISFWLLLESKIIVYLLQVLHKIWVFFHKKWIVKSFKTRIQKSSKLFKQYSCPILAYDFFYKGSYEINFLLTKLIISKYCYVNLLIKQCVLENQFYQ